MVLDVLRTQHDGAIRRDALIEAGLTPEAAGEALTLEWRRKVDPGMYPGMRPADRKAAVRAAEGNRTIARLAMFWRAMAALVAPGGPQASGWAALAEEAHETGNVRVHYLKGRKPIREGWHAPTLLIDANLDMNLVRPFWRGAELIASVEAEAPYQRVYQVVDASFSKRRLAPRDDLGAPEAARRNRNLQNLHAQLATIGRQYAPGRVLVVVQKAIEEALPGLGPLPTSIELAHHNAVAGRDEWKGVAAVVVVGRTAPPPADVERLAEALTGSAVPLLAGWYPKAEAGREMADGSPLEAEADRHPDPVAEAIRWQICEGELLQIIGRARGVNRTQADQVDVLVLTDVPLPLPLHGTFRAAGLAPTEAERMLAAGGIAFENSTDAADFFPQFWSNRKAADQALARCARSRLATNPYRDLLIRVCRQPLGENAPNLRRLDYQRAGPGRSRAVAWYDPAVLPDPVAATRAVLGSLAWVSIPAELVDDAPPPPPPSARVPVLAKPESRLEQASREEASPPPALADNWPPPVAGRAWPCVPSWPPVDLIRTFGLGGRAAAPACLQFPTLPTRAYAGVPAADRPPWQPAGPLHQPLGVPR